MQRSPRRGEERRGPKEIDQAQRCSSRGRGGWHERSDKGSLLVVDELDVVGVAVDVGGVEGGEAGFGVGERAGDEVGVVEIWRPTSSSWRQRSTERPAGSPCRRSQGRLETLTDDSSSGDY